VCVAAIMRRSAYNIILLSETRPTRGPQKQYALSQHPRRRTPSAQRPTPWSITHIPPTPSLDSFCILRSPFAIRHPTFSIPLWNVSGGGGVAGIMDKGLGWRADRILWLHAKELACAMVPLTPAR